MSVLVQQHLVYWNTDAEDNVTFYEANQDTSYALIRAGKYIKLTEDRFGEFAGGIISNLLLLGHARIGDLVQAYKIARPKDIKGVSESVRGLPNSTLPGVLISKELDDAAKNQSHTVEYLHSTLSDLLQAGFITTIHESHFRTDVDNRSEAEKEIPHPKSFAGKFKRDLEIEWERSIQQKLDGWKHGSETERVKIAGLHRGKKRLLEDPEVNHNFKRQRADLPLSKTVIESTGYETKLKTSGVGFLDVCLLPARFGMIVGILTLLGRYCGSHQSRQVYRRRKKPKISGACSKVYWSCYLQSIRRGSSPAGTEYTSM